MIEISVPSLNDRAEDIPLLVEHFTNSIASENGSAAKKFDDKAIKSLQQYDWTGNIRELRNVVERLIILGADPVTADDVASFVKK